MKSTAMSKRITLTLSEQSVLNYILRNVAQDLEYDEQNDDYCDCGGIICCLDQKEHNALTQIMKKIQF